MDYRENHGSSINFLRDTVIASASSEIRKKGLAGGTPFAKLQMLCNLTSAWI